MSDIKHPESIRTSQYSKSAKTVFCILSYISFLFIIGLIAESDDDRIRFHANQGLVLFLFESSFLMLYIITILGTLGGILSLIAAFVFIALGIINVLNNDEKPLPLIGKFHILK